MYSTAFSHSTQYAGPPPTSTGQSNKTKEARYRKASKRLGKQQQKPEYQEAVILQKTAALLLRDLYRQIASALHPDREPDENLRRQKTEWMTQANAAKDRQDWLSLVSLRALTINFSPKVYDQSDDKDLAALTLLLKKQVVEMERDRARRHQALMGDLQLPVLRELSMNTVHHALQEKIKRLQKTCEALEKQIATLRDPTIASTNFFATTIQIIAKAW